MRRISIEVVGLAATALAAGCAQEFTPGSPWYLPADDDHDDHAHDDDTGESTTGAADDGEADDGEASDPSDPPGDESGNDDGNLDTMSDGGMDESSEAGDAPPQGSPYQGGWDIGDCQNDIPPATNDPGGTLENLTFSDQYGDQVKLHDFCHKAILLIEGAFW